MAQNRRASSFQRRIAAARLRIDSLSSLRHLAALPGDRDITARQWSVLDAQLVATASRLQARLKRAARASLPRLADRKAARALNAVLGEIELEMTGAFVLFDTYMDILTQRASPGLGPVLAGCDVLAWETMRKDHPALSLIEPPLVYCDRGFGASILREGVVLPDNSPNPMPLIQIPYSRLKEKYNLTSVLHEAGHEALVRVGLVTVLPATLRREVGRAGGAPALGDLFALWASEIGPDFWTFCAAGAAQAAGIREILALPPGHVFRVSWTDPHPPPYLRVLLSFEWCRQVWGRGDWDDWEQEWLDWYPLDAAPLATRQLLTRGRALLPAVARALLDTRFVELVGRAIPDLFDLSSLNPAALRRVARTAAAGKLDLRGLSAASQLGVFREVRDGGNLAEETIDRTMTDWLVKLGERRPLVVH